MDFRTNKNPNGQWFYGFSSYGGTTLTPLPAAKDILAVPGLNGWAMDAGTFPFVAKNTTDAVIAGSGFEVPPGEVVLHPGNATAAADVVYVRWVAPRLGPTTLRPHFADWIPVPMSGRLSSNNWGSRTRKSFSEETTFRRKTL